MDAGARRCASSIVSERASAARRATRCSRTSRRASSRGRVFGFHRAMDHAGAVLGPLIASLFLYLLPGSIPHALRADAHSRRHRHRDSAARAGRTAPGPRGGVGPRAGGHWTACTGGRCGHTRARRFLQSDRRHLSLQPRQRERRVPAAAPERSRRRGVLDSARVVRAPRGQGRVVDRGGDWSDRFGRRT